MQANFCAVQKSIPRSTGVAFHSIYYLKSGNLSSTILNASSKGQTAHRGAFCKKVTASTLSYTKATGPLPALFCHQRRIVFTCGLVKLPASAKSGTLVSQEKKFEWIFNENGSSLKAERHVEKLHSCFVGCKNEVPFDLRPAREQKALHGLHYFPADKTCYSNN
jgi:hypothetical protein